MPEKLVAVFAPNRQNIEGLIKVIRLAAAHRRDSRDERGLVMFPLASRIDAQASKLRTIWWKGGTLVDKEVVGYQKTFEQLFIDVFDLDREECDLHDYFDATQIPHDSDYAYGEEIAARSRVGTADKLSIGAACANLTERLVTLQAPWESLPEHAKLTAVQRQADEAILTAKEFEMKERRSRRIAIVVLILALFMIGIATTLFIRQRVLRQREEARLAEIARLAEKYNSSGSLELANKNYDLAISDFNEAIKTKPDYAEAYLNRARAYGHALVEDRKELAIADYSQAIKLKPDLAVAYFERGDLYSRNISDELAVSDYTSAIKIKPDYWNAYLNRGFTLENRDNFEAAILDYNQIISSDSTEFKPTAYLRRGSTYLSMKDKEHARTDLLKAIALTLDPAVRTPATSALSSLGYLPLRETQPPITLNIFLQYSDSKDAPVINDISKSLKDSGYNVEAKELIVTQTGGEVLYYSFAPETKASAEKIRDVVAQTLADKSKLKLDLVVSYKGKDAPYVPRENIEVWLPPLQKLVQPTKK
jgi:tetratricopeptide (TPR) repeat protein